MGISQWKTDFCSWREWENDIFVSYPPIYLTVQTNGNLIFYKNFAATSDKVNRFGTLKNKDHANGNLNFVLVFEGSLEAFVFKVYANENLNFCNGLVVWSIFYYRYKPMRNLIWT
jgi:hypothetical protein